MSTYLKFYALTKPPFDVRPGKGPVLATRPICTALAWVREQLDEDRGILCVTGAPGVGRTSLARVLPGDLARDSHVARIVDPSRPWHQLEEDIRRQLCVPDLSRSSLVDARALGDRVVLIVDAVERASAGTLEHLDGLLDLRGPARERLVQAVVLARAEGDRSAGPELWQWLTARGAAVRDLDPISPEEIHRYIWKRLQHAGRVRDSLFTEAASLVVHRHSHGVPRRVNYVCDAVLREALRRCTRRIDGGLVSDVMGTTGRLSH